MLHFNPHEKSTAEIHRYLLGGVAPRPIALVSTISDSGVVNLSPFSFFNAFGANPPTVAFSPSLRVRDGSRKDTCHNLIATHECVIQAVPFDIVEQVSLASTEYDTDIDEFVKSGLTPIRSDLVRPPRVAESPFQMECQLSQMVPLGDGPGAGNLAICEVVRFHIDEDIIGPAGTIEPDLIDLVGRNSADYYTRASGQAIFEVRKPVGRQGIGYDRLPDFIRSSDVLTGNNLAQLANCETIPDPAQAEHFADTIQPCDDPAAPAFHRWYRLGRFERMLAIVKAAADTGHPHTGIWLQLTARIALDHRQTEFAWNTLIWGHSRGLL
jgi:flavin reductase (DIM6/NTAB) family NADH-FMN oxidoreductase RutF